MGELSKLPNIGGKLEECLNDAGITTREELISLGAEKAWLKLYERDSSACMHKLLALEGAVEGVKKTLIPDERKRELKEFFDKSKSGSI